VSLLNRRRVRRAASALISDLTDHTTIDDGGAVRSIQAADVDLPERELISLWSAMNLERLARTYWWYLSRISLGAIRVHYSETDRAVVFLTRPFVLLRFQPPEYRLEDLRGLVRWQIRDGLLVSKDNAGYLEIDVRLCRPQHPGYGRVHVEVEVANFYPALARPFRWFYRNTQSRIHVIVTKGFLKRLERLELEESAVGRFAAPEPAGVTVGTSTNGDGPEREAEDVTVGSTPWAVVAALAAAFAMVVLALGWSLRARR
jgi:hypothetical protein